MAEEKPIGFEIIEKLAEPFKAWDQVPGTRKEKKRRQEAKRFIVFKIMELGTAYMRQQTQDMIEVAKNPLFDRRQKN